MLFGGTNACSDVNKAYENIARSIAAYERSGEVTQFTSKYDWYLKGQAKLTPKEAQGLALFNGKGKCAPCHLSVGLQDPKRPIFTNFTFDNPGVPKNLLNPFYYNFAFNPQNVHWVDLGLGGFLNDPTQYGKQQVPTLRNVGKKPSPGFVKAYSHNGYFKSLDAIVHFYNTRDVLPTCSDPLAIGDDPGVNCWPAPEVSENVNRTEVGNLGLTVEEEGAIVAFLKTLSDGWSPPQP